jgi:uncharacterized protein (DUF433 family)
MAPLVNDIISNAFDRESSRPRSRSVGESSLARPAVIEKTPGVCGGEPRIAGTRIAVRTLVLLHRSGRSKEAMASDYGLASDQVEAAMRYAAKYGDEIEALIERNRNA